MSTSSNRFTLFGINPITAVAEDIVLINTSVLIDFFQLVAQESSNDVALALHEVAHPMIFGASFRSDEPDISPDKYTLASLKKFNRLKTLGKAIIGEEAYCKFASSHTDNMMRRVNVDGNSHDTPQLDNKEAIASMKKVADDAIPAVTNMLAEGRYDMGTINNFVSALCNAINSTRIAALITIAMSFKKDCSNVLELGKQLDALRRDIEAMTEKGLIDSIIDANIDYDAVSTKLDNAKIAFNGTALLLRKAIDRCASHDG